MSKSSRQHIDTGISHKIYDNVTHKDATYEWAVTTDSGNAIELREDGNRVDFNPKTSLEVVGEKCVDDEPAKVIYAQNGDIYLDAPAGDIIIRARNIRIVASDGSGEITLRSGKIIEFNGPVVRTKGTNVDITATNEVGVYGQTVDQAGNVQVASSSFSDVTQGSFVGSILSAISNLKKFLRMI